MIIFGLGNQGAKYRATRHNVGYIFLDRLVKLYRRRFRLHKGYKSAKIKVGNTPVKLIKPMCWMNQSGSLISNILQEQNDEFMVVVDDINLPLGKIRIRASGSDGGHLGLRSIIEAIENCDFKRLRIGIGRSEEDAARYVLSKFKRGERKVLRGVMEQGIKGIEILMKQGFNKAQNYMNGIDLSIKSEVRNPKS